MRIVSSTGTEAVAIAYVARSTGGELVEFTEAVQPPIPREQKWVVIVSSLYGCPARCAICDAGGNYRGRMSRDEIFEQLDFLVDKRFPGRNVVCDKFKVQFARVGEPTLNPAVLSVLEQLPDRYNAPGLMPAVSTIAPVRCDDFLARLHDVKDRLYPNGRFQLQFSIHTTDVALRDRLIPMPKWGFEEIGNYGAAFHSDGDRKVTLNFALAQGTPIDAEVLLEHFDPADFLIKITPVNPTHRAVRNGIVSHVDPGREEARAEIERLSDAGYDVLLSVGELEENSIGSNCGQYIQRHLESGRKLDGAYARVDERAEEGLAKTR